MFHLWVIALYLSIVWRDMIGAPLAHEWLNLPDRISAMLVPLILIAVVTTLRLRWLTRRLERTGSYRAVRAADRTLNYSRWAAVLVHVVGVLVLGWMDAVRTLIGDLIIVDELIVMAPALIVFILGWVSAYPMERLLRESAIYSTLHAQPAEQGQRGTVANATVGSTGVLYPVPTRWEYVRLNIRHQLLLSLAPLLLLGTWGETMNYTLHAADRAAQGAVTSAGERGERTPRLAAWFADADNLGATAACLQLVGVLGVFIASPLVMRAVWDTVPLEDGPTRERLIGLCRAQRLRVRNILVWRTHGTLMNGAVMGLIPQVRYILLTDVMLDTMPMRELEAVMAHELAHVKHRHMLWLGAALVVSVAVTAMAAAEGLALAGYDPEIMRDDGLVEIFTTMGTLLVALVVFGFVSRRFEWQADAYATKCLSLPGETKGTISGEAVQAMSDALGLVASINHMPRHAPSWRHGSIALRQDKLESIVGQPKNGLAVDRNVRIIKWIVGLAALGLIGLGFGLFGGSGS